MRGRLGGLRRARSETAPTPGSQAPLGRPRREAPLPGDYFPARRWSTAMTRSRYRIYDSNHPHFITCTIVGWLPVFSRPPVVNIILDSWRFLQREREFSLFGYVIMENHIHLIARAPDL